MDEKILQNIGLSKNESLIYLTLIELGMCTANQIAKKSHIYRRNVYDSLEKLIEKGLVNEILVSKRRLFKPVHPRRLKEILEEKEDSIEKIMPELAEKFNEIKTEEEAHIFKGIDGIKTILTDVLDERKTMHLLGAKGKWFDPRLKYFLPHFEKKRLKFKIHLKHIFDHEARGGEATKLKLNEFKFLPKNFSSKTHVWIYGDKVVSLYWADEPLAIMIKSKPIADGYKKYFNFIWNRCKK